MRTLSFLLVPALFGALLAGAGACGGVSTDESDRRTTGPGGTEGETLPPPDPTTAFDAAQIQAYLRQLAPYFAARELSAEELGTIEAAKFEAVQPIVRGWTEEALFPRAARRLIAQKLSVSGTRDDIDFDLPGNLAEHVVRENLPLSTLLTADYCIDAAGAKTTCDTGAPFTAGVLGTRAFMASRASRFNLTRASTMLRTFACQHYPMQEALEPRIARERLIPLFQVDQQDAGTETFGNGSACYSCHGQFGPHAQLFVRFAEDGRYREDATGIQDEEGELGRAKDGLFASHLLNPEEAKGDRSQMFGKPVQNLGEAAKVLAESPTFVSCQVENLFEYALRLPTTAVPDPAVLAEILEGAGANPTFGALVVATFSHPRVVSAVVSATVGTP